MLRESLQLEWALECIMPNTEFCSQLNGCSQSQFDQFIDESLWDCGVECRAEV